jgi:hypothetical protein
MNPKMTIDSTWLHAFKEEAPHAFTKRDPFQPRAIFVDGQIKLMQGFQREPQTWDQFIHRQFTRHLQKWFETCDVVILAFDNYERVPKAKCMTQAKRRKHIPAIPFGEHSELPSMVPEGERWTQCIANRKFKTRVIDLVLLRLPQLLLLSGEAHSRKRLVVDYWEPREYSYNSVEHRVTSVQLEGMTALGEADIKFPRYADRYSALLVDSIDGDSVPIALMHLESHLRATAAQRVPQVSIYRMELHLVGTERTAGVKRRGSPGDEPGGAADTLAKRERRTYEFVHINALYWQLKQAIAQSVGRVVFPTHQGHEMAMLVGLIALTGTDFSRHLPQMSGKTVFNALPDIWGTLVACFDVPKGELRVDAATDLLVLQLYKAKFHAHTKGWSSIASLGALLTELHRASKLSARVKNTLPTVERISCTVRNANWVLAYWGGCGDFGVEAPNPVQPAYGFRQLANGATDYADLGC